MTHAEKSIQSQPMYKVKLSHVELRKLCQQLDRGCNAENLDIYKLKNSDINSYYSILDSLRLYKLEINHENFKILDQWDFKNYQHHNVQVDDEDRTRHVGMKIYPALYPLNKNELSIAIVNEWFGGYAGGGVSEQFADFVKLQPNGKYSLALEDIHFYSSEMIRACFSEKDYQNSAHCHDETGTLLNIKFNDIGEKYYQWTLIYTDFDWPAFVPEKQKKMSKRSEKVMPFNH